MLTLTFLLDFSKKKNKIVYHRTISIVKIIKSKIRKLKKEDKNKN